MQMRALVLLLAAVSAGPAWSADAAKRDADRPTAARLLATPAEPATSANQNDAAAPARKPKRVRYTIPAPTRM
ncbi:MAG TPA: hypothetical protein VF460_10140 [Burkholderiales bacterium]